MAHGKLNKLSGIVGVGFAYYILAMGIYGIKTNTQFVSDGFAANAFGNQFYNFEFPFA